MLVIKNGQVITGDGSTVMDQGTIYIEGGQIVEVREGNGPRADGEVIDAQGAVVVPGIINPHSHGIATGPMFATAAAPLTSEQAMAHLDRHLAMGVTSIVSMDGFGLPEEFEAANRAHPLNIFFGTTHLPKALDVAEIADGEGLTEAHRAMTAEKAVAGGAIAFAEIGGGHTLGGGGQDYMYIPMAVEKATGKRLDPSQARKLKESVLSRHIRRDAYQRENVEAVLAELGLADKLSAEDARDLIRESVLPSFQKALDGFHEAADYALRFGLPTLVHNAASSGDATHAIAEKLGPLLIAGHTNHTTYTPEESLASGKFLRQTGAVIEISVLNLFGSDSQPPHIYGLVEAGLVDILGTDYAGGKWEGVLLGVERMVKDGVITLAQAIQLSTANVAKAMRVGNRGELAPGKWADVAILDAEHPSQVRSVVIGGRLAYDKGQVLFGDHVTDEHSKEA